MRALAHHAFALAFAALAALIAGEDQVMITLGIFGLAVACFHLGRAIPRGATRVQMMAWWLPPAAAAAVLFL